ncbi:MAG: DUF551 domain-containing protein [Desulfobacteraceae bacterium]|nr:DUF551 domain-containing protein [Desulfobacteraceae bacterium]
MTDIPTLINRIKDTANRADRGAYNSNVHIANLFLEAADALEAQQWQPIETAPKDGTWVLLYIKTSGAHRGNFQNNKWLNESFFNRKEAPTHWQPLSHPPVKGE